MSRIDLEITLGIILVLITGAVLIVYGLNEEERMANFEFAQQARAIEEGAVLFDTNCRGCHGPQGEGTPGLAPPLNDRYFFEQRLSEVGWSGSLNDYIVSTVSSGRLRSTRPDQYPGNVSPAMPAWSDQIGGPLRADQIHNIAAFIINWESTAPDREQAPEMAGEAVGSDITQELYPGDVAKGEELATSQGCVGCHVSTTTGPAWGSSEGEPGIGNRALTRLDQADYSGQATTAEQYLFESIVNPNIFVVEGYEPNLMPDTYSQSLTVEDASDLIAYMLTLK
jgi:mono/diheme cytochrome c family protein